MYLRFFINAEGLQM